MSACYLLDVLEQPTGDLKFFVDLRLDDLAALHDLGPRMQQVLRRYPDYADRFFVGASAIAGATDEHAAALN